MYLNSRTQPSSQWGPNTCPHPSRYPCTEECMHTHTRTHTPLQPLSHTHLPQAPGTALCQVSWDRDRLQPATEGRCPGEQCLPSPPPAQTQGAIVSLVHATGSLSTGSPGRCACVGAEGWQLPRPTCSPIHPRTLPPPDPLAWSCRP